MEIWKDIPGYEGLYKISNRFNVKSLERTVRHWRGGTRTYPEKAKIIYIGNNGYYYVNLSKEGKIKKVMMHRIIGLVFIPNPENKPCINHKDGDKINNGLNNLEWSTYKENNNHASEIGLNNLHGTNNGRSKITESDVIEIRAMHNLGIKTIDISNRFNITTGHVRKIVRGMLWNHI